jgi:hypothetical protein
MRKWLSKWDRFLVGPQGNLGPTDYEIAFCAGCWLSILRFPVIRMTLEGMSSSPSMDYIREDDSYQHNKNIILGDHNDLPILLGKFTLLVPR